MSNWMLWLGSAGVMAILEMFTGTFYLLMIGLGLAAGGLAALAGAGLEAQFGIAAVTGVLTTYALRRSRFGRGSRANAAHDPNVNLDIGQTLLVEHWRQEGGRHLARVPYRGANWDVELMPGETPVKGHFRIREVRGSRLIVSSQP